MTATCPHCHAPITVTLTAEPQRATRAELAKLVGIAETLTPRKAWEAAESWAHHARGWTEWDALDAALGLTPRCGSIETEAAFLAAWGTP